MPEATQAAQEELDRIRAWASMDNERFPIIETVRLLLREIDRLEHLDETPRRH